MADGTQSSRRNPTRVVAIVDAGSVAVCKAGDKVALHFYTTEGEFVFRLREREFILGCRAPRDANGNPLRTFEQLEADLRHRYDELQAGIDQDRAAAIGISTESLILCEKAWGLYVTDKSLSQARAAKAVGVSLSTFNVWVRLTHGDEAAKLHQERAGSFVLHGRYRKAQARRTA